MALFVRQYFITIKYIVWQKTAGTKVASKATRVHKVVNKVRTRDARGRVLRVELSLPVTRKAKADAVVKAWVTPPRVEAQALIRTVAAVANANDCKLSKTLCPAMPGIFLIVNHLCVAVHYNLSTRICLFALKGKKCVAARSHVNENIQDN